MSFILSALRQVGSTARGEAWLALRAAPAFFRPIAVVAAWGATAILLGMIVGVSAVVLPPTGTFGIVAVTALVLLWATPELAVVPDAIIRRLFFVMLVVDLCVPFYYTVQVPGLPWISARRIVTFPVILLFAIACSGSASVRKRIAPILRSNGSIVTCAFGFLAMIVISILTSINPSASLSQATDAVLEWYVPFLVILFVVRSEEDVLTLVRVVCWCSIFVSLGGVAEFIAHKHVFMVIMPKFLVDSLAAANPSFAAILTNDPIRNGMWRASSVYTVSLSLGEFEAMIAPLAYFFLAYGRTMRDRIFGSVLVGSCIAGIFSAGSRGGYISFLVATAAFVVIWLVRRVRFQPNSLAPAIAGLFGGLGFALVIFLIIFWRRAHNIVLGGGMETYSDQGRSTEWAMGLPKILANPITGHGFAQGGEVVGYYSPGAQMPTIDSYTLSLLVETGVPGFLFFFGVAVFAARRGIRQFLLDSSPPGALAGTLGCSIIAFSFYRVFLSQRENHMLFFVMIGCVMLLNHFYLLRRR